MAEMDWDDVDEFPESVECDWCGFVECACDELEDIHDFDQEMIGLEE
jgi:hypothetical protein